MDKRSLRAALYAMVCLPALAGPGIRGLDASGPAPEWAAKLMLFGQFAGDWDCDVALTLPDGSKIRGTCEWHFGWTLEGRAIQDVWIARYGESKPGAPTGAYGTTLRWYEPNADLWHAIWVSPRDNTTHTFVARKVGQEIVLDSQDPMGHPYRWIFSEVTPESFHWRSEGSPDAGKTWFIGQEMAVRRSNVPRSKTSVTTRNPEVDRQAIEELEQRWLNGESDRAVLDRILADDFLHPVAAGLFLTKRQHIDWSVQHPRLAGRKARFEKLDVRLYGDTAIATGIVDDTDVAGGDRRRSIFTDVFAYRNGEWQAVGAEENALVPAPGASTANAQAARDGANKEVQMGNENAQLLLEIFSAIERRDEKRLAELFDPEFEIHWPPSLPYGGTSRGVNQKHPTWGETWAPLQPTAAERKMDPRIIAAQGDEVTVLWHQRGVDARGARIDCEVLGLYEVHHGRLTRAQMFYFDSASVAKFLSGAGVP